MAGAREAALKLLAVIATVALAAGLAACGDGGSTTSSSTAGKTSSQSASTGSTGQSSSKTQGSSQGKATSEGSPKADRGSGSGSSSRKVNVKVAPLHVSGGGSAHFVTKKGGDNSIQEYGEESSETELTEAAEALHSYLVAFASDDWTTACSYMTKDLAHNLEQLASQGKGSSKQSCPTVAAGLFGAVDRSSQERHELTEVDAASLRREGEQAFLLYHGPEYDTGGYYGPGDLYAMLMKQEDGEWKVGAAAGNQMGLSRSLEH